MATICQVSGRRKIARGALIIESLQLIRDVSISILGIFRAGGSDGLRPHGHQKFYTLLGFAHVRLLLGHQHYCAVEHAHRYDVELVSNHLGEKRH